MTISNQQNNGRQTLTATKLRSLGLIFLEKLKRISVNGGGMMTVIGDGVQKTKTEAGIFFSKNHMMIMTMAIKDLKPTSSGAEASQKLSPYYQTKSKFKNNST